MICGLQKRGHGIKITNWAVYANFPRDDKINSHLKKHSSAHVHFQGISNFQREQCVQWLKVAEHMCGTTWLKLNTRYLPFSLPKLSTSFQVQRTKFSQTKLSSARVYSEQGLQRVRHGRRRNTSWRTADERKQLEEVNKKKKTVRKKERGMKREGEANPDFPGRGWRRVKAQGSKQCSPARGRKGERRH